MYECISYFALLEMNAFECYGEKSFALTKVVSLPDACLKQCLLFLECFCADIAIVRWICFVDGDVLCRKVKYSVKTS